MPPPPASPAQPGRREAWLYSDSGKKMITLFAALYLLMYLAGFVFSFIMIAFVDIDGASHPFTTSWPFLIYASFAFIIQTALICVALWYLWKRP